MDYDPEAAQFDFAKRRDHDDALKAVNLASLDAVQPLPLSQLARSKIRVVRGSIVDQDVECIVNAANEALTGGGGVDGVIHNACGEELRLECLKLPADDQGARCMTGDAKITKAFRIRAKFVVHTVGPYLDAAGHTQPKLLSSCYYKSLQLAKDHGLHSIAFPSISSGYYGYPIAEAGKVGIKTIEHFLQESPAYDLTVVLVAFDELTHKIYLKLMSS